MPLSLSFRRPTYGGLLKLNVRLQKKYSSYRHRISEVT